MYIIIMHSLSMELERAIYLPSLILTFPLLQYLITTCSQNHYRKFPIKESNCKIVCLHKNCLYACPFSLHTVE